MVIYHSKQLISFDTSKCKRKGRGNVLIHYLSLYKKKKKSSLVYYLTHLHVYEAALKLHRIIIMET